MNECTIKYDEYIKIAKDGDLLLFKGSGIVSKLIQWYTKGSYSHAALVSLVYGKGGDITGYEVVEFREFVGSRITNLQNYIQIYPGQIDVFSPVTYHNQPFFDCNTKTRSNRRILFNGRRIVNELRNHTGRPYSYRSIIAMFLYYLPLPLLSKGVYDDRLGDNLVSAVCSSSIAYCFNKHFLDLVPHRADDLVSPADLSRSCLVSLMGTLIP